jgi:hypothetical protein
MLRDSFSFNKLCKQGRYTVEEGRRAWAECENEPHRRASLRELRTWWTGGGQRQEREGRHAALLPRQAGRCQPAGQEGLVLT